MSLPQERGTTDLVFYTSVARFCSESSSFTASALNQLSSSSSSSESTSQFTALALNKPSSSSPSSSSSTSSEVRSEPSRTSTAGGMITDSRGKRKKRG